MCVSNLLFVQSTGFYLLEVISNASSIPLLLIGLAECIGVAFVYGMERSVFLSYSRLYLNKCMTFRT